MITFIMVSVTLVALTTYMTVTVNLSLIMIVNMIVTFLLTVNLRALTLIGTNYLSGNKNYNKMEMPI